MQFARIGALLFAAQWAACAAGSTDEFPTTPKGTAATAASQPGAVAPTFATEVEGISEYTLPNGMRVLLFPDASQARVTVNVTYFVGSRHEGYGEAGMAHLLEHMLFKGTPNHPNVWAALTERGASFNGSTWFDRTNYFETLAASDENLEFALKLEADRMLNSTIAESELQKEFSVVRNEFERGENSPTDVLEERMYASAYLWHNYGKTTIGNRSDIERVPVSRLREFYKKYYQPDNAILIVAGKFEKAAALKLVGAHFGALPRPTRELEPTYTVEPVQDGERTVTLRRVGDVAAVGALYHALPGAHPDSLALDAALHILTNEPSGRLYQSLVRKGWASDVRAMNYPTREPGMAIFMATVAKDKAPDLVREKLLATIEEFANSNITDAEVERFINQQRADFELAFADSQRIAVQLSEYAAMGDWRLLFLQRDRLDSLKAADVKRVAKAYFLQSNRTVGTFVPTKEPVRAPETVTPDIQAMVKDYKGRAATAAGEVFEPTFANIDKRTQTLALSNGMKVALLSKQTRGNAVKANLVIRFGSEASLAGGLIDAAGVLPSLLLRGTATRDYQAVLDELARLKAQVSVGRLREAGGGNQAALIQIETVKENLPAVLSLVGELAKKPALSDEQFKIVMTEKLAALEQQKSDPMALGMNIIARRLAPYPAGDIRYVPTIEESIARLRKVTLAQVKAVHRELWGTDQAQLAIVGDFDPAGVTPVLEREFGTWKAQKAYARIARSYSAPIASNDIIKVADKPMAAVGFAQVLNIREDHADFVALDMAAYVFAGNSSSRLLTRLRHNGGMSYGAFGQLMASPFDPVAAFFAAAIVNPDNAPKALAAALEELNLMLSKPMTDAELKTAQAAYLQETAQALADDDFLVSQLAANLFTGRNFAFYKSQQDSMQALTPAQIQAAAAKHIVPQKLATLMSGDFE